VPGSPWNNVDPADGATVLANVKALTNVLKNLAPLRAIPTLNDVLAWHSALYAGCAVPCDDYLGHLRGDRSIPELVGYDVGVGPTQPDGYPSKVGVWSQDVFTEVEALLRGIAAALVRLDAIVPVGSAPGDPVELQAVVALCAVIHGEWVRIHPFANGSGRTARFWAAFIALRYGLPVFVTVTPRPNDAAYALAGTASTGRPPDFQGDHRPAINLFANMLTAALHPLLDRALFSETRRSTGRHLTINQA
jgi:hypothetical protein